MFLIFLGWRISKLRKTYLSLGHILCEDVVNIAVLLLLLRLDLFLPASLQYLLQLGLLLRIKLVSILKQLYKLFFAEMHLGAIKLAIWTLILIVKLPIVIISHHILDWLPIFVNCNELLLLLTIIILIFVFIILLHLHLLLVQ